MTRLAYLATSLTVLAAALPATALADDGGIKFDYGGFLDGSIFNDHQDVSGFNRAPRNDVDGLVNGKVFLKGSYLLDNGIEIGARFDLRLQSGQRSDDIVSGRDSALQLEKAYVWAESGLGRLELGAQDGAADQMQIAPPSVTKSMRIDHPLMMPVSDGNGEYYRPGDLMLRTDFYASDQSAKIVYRSPRLFGFQLAVSYTPEFSANLEDYENSLHISTDQQSHIFESGLNYDTNFDKLRVRASLVYLLADKQNPSDTTSTLASPWRSANLSEWGGAASLKYDGITFGGAYRHSNARGGLIDDAPVVLTGGASDTNIWSLGALYEVDSWKFGANYAHGNTNVALGAFQPGQIGKQDGEGWQIAAAYAFTTDLQLSAGFQRYDFGTSNGINPLGLAEAIPAGLPGYGYVGNLDADIVFTEFSIGF